MTFVRSGNIMGNTHQGVQIHVRVDEIWRGVISERFSGEEHSCTIVVGTVGVHGRDLSNRYIEGRCQSRLVGHLSETLQQNQSPPSVLLRVAGSYIDRIEPFSTLSLG